MTGSALGAGAFDKRATFERYEPVADGGGGMTDTWQTVFTRWARLIHPEPSVQAEKLAGGATHVHRSRLLILRDDPASRGIGEGWRVTVLGALYAINEVTRDTAAGQIRIAISTGAAD